VVLFSAFAITNINMMNSRIEGKDKKGNKEERGFL
jgi:hypothetical protein